MNGGDNNVPGNRYRYQILNQQEVPFIPTPNTTPSNTPSTPPNITTPTLPTPPKSPTPPNQPNPNPPPKHKNPINPANLPNPTRGLSPLDLSCETPSILLYPTDSELSPPKADLDFIVKEAKNCSPRYMRSSMYVLPTAPDRLRNSSLPFALFAQPLAEVPPNEAPLPLLPLANQEGPARCKRCRAYLSPFMTISNGSYKCPFCGCFNDLSPNPSLPFLDTPMSELQHPSYEYNVSSISSFKHLEVEAPCIIFLMETTQRTLGNGLVSSWMMSIERILPTLFGDSPVRFGFITFDSQITFYNLCNSLSMPSMHVVSDPEHSFSPLDGSQFLLRYRESQLNLSRLLKCLPDILKDTPATDSCLGAALRITPKLLKNGGKVIVFMSSMPNIGPGILQKRNHYVPLDSTQEILLNKPQNEYYSKLSVALAKNSISVDLFVASPSYVDLSSLSPLCKNTGGQLYYYPSYSSYYQEQLYRELFRNLSREYGYDAIMRMRCGQGFVIKAEHGHCIKFTDTEMSLAQVHSDSTFLIEFNYEDSLDPSTKFTPFQIALLYTNTNGQRMLRIHNLSLYICNNMFKIYKGADLDVTLSYLTWEAIQQIVEAELKMPKIRKKVISRAVAILASYKKYCAKVLKDGQLLLPEALKYLPIYCLGLCKTPLLGPLRAGTLHHTLADTRQYYLLLYGNLPLSDQSVLYYPLLFEIHRMMFTEKLGTTREENDCIIFPGQVRLTRSSLEEDGIYLLDCLHHLYLWIGKKVSPLILEQLLPPEMLQSDDEFVVPCMETDLSRRLFALLDSRRMKRILSPDLHLIKQGSNLEQKLLKYLFEDGNPSGSDVKDFDYYNFLCYVHKQIQSLLDSN